MAIQYSGSTIIHRTYTPGSRADHVSNISQALFDAGWTTITGSPGSGATTVQESAAGNLGQKIRIIAQEPGSGTCAQLYLRHTSGSPTSQQFFINPANTWRIIATKYHFFAFMSGATFRLTSRSFICGGILYTPSFLNLVSNDGNGWLAGNAISDADVAAHQSWRSTLRQYDNANSAGRFSGIYINTLADITGYTTNSGAPTIVILQGGWNSDGWRWEDNTALMYEPLVSYATGGISGDSRIHGQIYDAIVVSGQFSSETTINFDSHNWLAITDQATGSINADATLFVAVT